MPKGAHRKKKGSTKKKPSSKKKSYKVASGVKNPYHGCGPGHIRDPKTGKCVPFV